MKKIIIIGTLHGGITPNRELRSIITKHKPTQILVEINQNDIYKNNIYKYPSEMIFTYKWAIKNKIKVNGFDSKINIFKKNITDNDNKKLIKEQDKIIKYYSWKDFNKIEKEKLLDDIDNITDPIKEKIREKKMLRNIKKVIDAKGTILIITGCGHLNFFEKNIKKAIFPFR